MVATRRGARTGQTEEPETDNASLPLRKKPVRRATAAKAAQSAPKPRTTRSKKTDVDPEESAPEPQEDVEESKPPTTRATRSRRAETAEPEPSEPAQTAKPAAQPKRPARTRSAKPADAAAPAPKASAATSSKPTLAARPTRQTRAKTPVAQAPLSPKKITQVSKVRTRNTRALANENPKLAPNTRAASTTQTTRTTRKRTVSDENAEIPELMPVEPAEREVESNENVQAAAKSSSRGKKSSVKQDTMKQDTMEEEQDEAQTSTRQTTPTDSPAPRFAQPKEYTQDNLDAVDQKDEDDTEDEEQSPSDDELCGPKTPMRRSKKAESRYYTSAQKSAKRSDPDVPLHTPPKRYGAQGATRPTPQTQKPQLPPAIPESATRPMTVGRAAGRPFVFRKLEKDETPAPKGAPSSIAEEPLENDTEEHPKEEGADAKSVTDLDIPEHGEAAELGAQDLEGAEHDENVALSTVDPDETIVVDEDDESDNDGTELIDSPTANAPVASYNDEDSMLDIDSSIVEPPVASYEPDDSMLDMDSPTAEPPVAHYEVDGDESANDHSDDGDSEVASDDEDASHLDATMFGLQTPKPQTIPWQSLREETTRIPVDFDMHFANVRSPSHVEPEVTGDAVEDLQNMQLDDVDDTFDLGNGTDEHAQDPTMNLNDFIDVAALAEPTMQLDILAGAQNEDVEADQADEDTENTVIIMRDESPELFEVPFEIEPEQMDLARAPSNASPAHALREALKQLSPLRNPRAPNDTEALSPSGDVIEEVDDEMVPHYALPTLSSRRKSLSALGNQTPVRSSSRPRTSDGASIARIAQPFDQPWWNRSRRASAVAPATEHTPSRGRGAPAPVKAQSIASAASSTPVQTPAAFSNERFPRHSEGLDHHARTIAAPARFHTPARSPVRHPATVQKLPTQNPQRSPMRAPAVSSATANKVATPSSARSPQRNIGSRANTESGPLRFRTPTSTATQRPATVQRSTSQTSAAGVTSQAEAPTQATPQERYPRRSARQAYNDHANTVAAPARFHTPIQGKPKRPATAQRLASQAASQPSTPPMQMTPEATARGIASHRTPKAAASPVRAALAVTPQARFPRLPAKRSYDEHATTVAGPSRFRSPAHASPKRPATSQKPVNLRKVALHSSFPSGSHTPIKTPLKPAAMTPSQVPMTPHPGAPLRGVVALVEVFTLDGASASAPFISLLQRLGARTTKSWSERVTHVIFKDGSPTTLQRVRINNKEVKETGKGFVIHCVNSRWVSDCDESGSRVDESDDAYAVDVTEVPRGGNRRRKSMEPSALINVGGNIVRDRKSSGGYGRNSIGRSAMKPDASGSKYSDEVPFTPGAKFHDLENEMDFDDDESEVSTPDYLAAPDKLVQMTAPMNRVRKLDLKKEEAKNRRLTFWNGGS